MNWPLAPFACADPVAVHDTLTFGTWPPLTSTMAMLFCSDVPSEPESVIGSAVTVNAVLVVVGAQSLSCTHAH